MTHLPVSFFSDCHGKGYAKTPHTRGLFVFGTIDTAIQKVKDVYDVDVEASTCSCCGPDFGIYEHDSLAIALEYWDITEDQLSGETADYGVII